ncbi:hypothetical protein [Arsenicicoccus dermatophilus]|nr:hypothetical protein [Arsenicicoccus dermatophilus]MCH8613477.1 hypothetical protein [Arsenicicoccus dermatophilus]
MAAPPRPADFLRDLAALARRVRDLTTLVNRLDARLRDVERRLPPTS